MHTSTALLIFASTYCILFTGVSTAVITGLNLYDQLARLKSLGYDVDRLDNHTQLKVFLYTMLSMERGEGGYVFLTY